MISSTPLYEEENDIGQEIMEEFYATRRPSFAMTVTEDPHTQDVRYLVHGLKQEVVDYAGMPKSYTCTCSNFNRNGVACVHITASHRNWRNK